MNCHDAVKQKAGQPDALEKIVMHALELRPAFRKAFLLCDIQGFTITETAAILGVSPQAVRVRLARARREVNARLRTTPQVDADSAQRGDNCTRE